MKTKRGLKKNKDDEFEYGEEVEDIEVAQRRNSEDVSDDEFIKGLEEKDKEIDLEKMTRRQRMAYFAAQA